MSSLKERTHLAARDGMAISLFALLCNRKPEEVADALDYFTEENGQSTTPLIIAARNGHSKVVRMLLTNFDVDVEQAGQVKFDGYVIEGATALWCAAGAGHLDVVKTLIEMGADPNNTTNSNSTPLRAACFDGRLEIVEYLLNNNADYTIANKYGNTCLMIASYKGHLRVAKALLSYGADPNLKASGEATALHFAAECGHVKIVEILMQYGATFQHNNTGMTPLLIAAENCKSEVIEYFLSEYDGDESGYAISQIEKIECLELLGTAFANDKDNYNIEKAYHYMWLALVERNRDEQIIKKVLDSPIEAYDNRTECQTVSEIEALEHNSHAIHMEALIMRERILGTDNPELIHPIVFRGAVFADMSQFDKCIRLWMRAMELRFRNKRSIGKDILRFAQVFSQMIHVGVHVDFTRILEVFQYSIKELRNHKKTFQASISGDSRLVVEEALESDMNTAMYLIALLCKEKLTSSQEFDVCKFIYIFNKMNLRLPNGMTPLHIASNAQTVVDDFHVCDVVKYPNAAMVRLLIHCGADTNAVDNAGDSPLHVIVKYDKPISDFLTLHSIIVLLCEYGCHMDRVNNKGLTPMSVCWTGVSEIILRTLTKINLKCLAARSIRQHHIDYKGHLPVSLEEFVALH